MIASPARLSPLAMAPTRASTSPVLTPMRRRRSSPSAARGLAHRERRVGRALRVVLVRDGRAEHAHHAVAGELHDAAVALDVAAHRLVEAVQRRADVLDVERLAAGGEADEVGEDHRDDAPLGVLRGRGEREPALAAELRRGGGRRPATAAGSRRGGHRPSIPPPPFTRPSVGRPPRCAQVLGTSPMRSGACDATLVSAGPAATEAGRDPAREDRPEMTRRTIATTAAALAALAAAPGLASAAYPGENGAIAYHSGRDGNYEVYTVQADGSGDTRRTTAPLTDQDPAYSRDGLRIAFTAQRDGGTGLDVWVMAANGAQPAQPDARRRATTSPTRSRPTARASSSTAGATAAATSTSSRWRWTAPTSARSRTPSATRRGASSRPTARRSSTRRAIRSRTCGSSRAPAAPRRS